MKRKKRKSEWVKNKKKNLQKKKKIEEKIKDQKKKNVSRTKWKTKTKIFFLTKNERKKNDWKKLTKIRE